MKKLFSNLPAEIMSAWHDAQKKNTSSETTNNLDIDESKIKNILNENE